MIMQILTKYMIIIYTWIFFIIQKINFSKKINLQWYYIFELDYYINKVI